jgi:WD40 repeat protein
MKLTDNHPYVGPRPFERSDAHRFFGRTQEANDLVSLIHAHPAIVLYAESGAGKSSLLNAKLVPLLEARSSQVFPVARVKGRLPIGINVQSIRNIYVFNCMVSLQVSPSKFPLENSSLSECLGPLTDPTEKSALRVIMFDQFEELFTSYPERWTDRAGFFDDLAVALEQDNRLRVVFALREEYVARLDPYAYALPERLRTRFYLQRLGRAAAREAITGPLALTGRRFDDKAATLLVDNLLRVPVRTSDGVTEIQGEFVEPVQLQLVCNKLWKSLPADVEVIDEQWINRGGSVDEALSSYYDDCVHEVAEESKVKVKEATLRQWFGKNLITSDKTRNMVYQEALKTGGLDNAIVQLLQDRYLVRPEPRAGALWFELTHDRFIAPILQSNQRWLNDRAQKDHQRFEAMADDWVNSGRAKTKLLSKDELKRAIAIAASAQVQEVGVSNNLSEFVQASQIHAERQTNRRLRRSLIAIASSAGLALAFAVAAIIAASIAFHASDAATKAAENESAARKDAEAATFIERGKLAEGLAGQPGKEFVALALGIRAVAPSLAKDEEPPPAAVKGLRDAIGSVGNYVWLRRPKASIQQLTFSPDGQSALSVSEKEIAVWDTSKGRLLFDPISAGKEASWSSSNFLPEGKWIYAWKEMKRSKADAKESVDSPDDEDPIILWNARTGDTGKLAHGDRLASTWNKGNRILVVNRKGTVRILDVSTGRSLVTFDTEITTLESATVSPDGSLAFLLKRHGNGLIADMATGKIVRRLEIKGKEKEAGRVEGVFSTDGRLIAVFPRLVYGKKEEALLIYDTKAETDARQIKIPGREWDIVYVFFSAHGERLVIVTDRIAYTYRVDTREMVNKSQIPSGLSTRYWEDGRIVVFQERKESASVDVVNVFTGKTVFHRDNLPFGSPTDISKDYRLIAGISEDNAGQIWEVGKPLLKVDGLDPRELLKIACKQIRYQPEHEEVKSECEE